MYTTVCTIFLTRWAINRTHFYARVAANQYSRALFIATENEIPIKLKSENFQLESDVFLPDVQSAEFASSTGAFT